MVGFFEILLTSEMSHIGCILRILTNMRPLRGRKNQKFTYNLPIFDQVLIDKAIERFERYFETIAAKKG